MTTARFQKRKERTSNRIATSLALGGELAIRFEEFMKQNDITSPAHAARVLIITALDDAPRLAMLMASANAAVISIRDHIFRQTIVAMARIVDSLEEDLVIEQQMTSPEFTKPEIPTSSEAPQP